MDKMRSLEYTYTPSHIANFFLNRKKHTIDNLKLNKIIYISLGYSLAILDRDLFEENVEAWQYGPVIPSIYHEFKRYGMNRIDAYSEIYDYSLAQRIIPTVNNNEKDLIELLKAILNYYGRLSSYALIQRTHQTDSPWSKFYQKDKPGIVIEKEVIKEYYKNLIEN